MCEKKKGLKAYYSRLKNSSNRGRQKRGKGAKRHLNLCPHHEIVLVRLMEVLLSYIFNFTHTSDVEQLVVPRVDVNIWKELHG